MHPPEVLFVTSSRLNSAYNFVIREKTAAHGHPAASAAVDRRSVADKQLNLNGCNPFSRRSSVPRDQREKAVAECSDHGSNPVQGTMFFSFLLFAINKAYF